MNGKIMVLSGDENTLAMPLTDAQVNHLRRLLAWMRLEYTLDENMQAGYLRGVSKCVEHGFATPERSSEVIQDAVDRINHVPLYLRQGIKMLTKALYEHDKKSGVIES